jgi:hypothetical protein
MKITVFSVRAAALGVACLLACSLAVAVSPAGAEVPDPFVTGPIPANAPPGDPSHDYPLLATALDLASLGYVEEEYFFSGTANVYNIPPLTTATIVSSGHPYKSRLIVRRPTSPEKFNGTVLVEWANVSSGFCNDGMFQRSQDHLLRAGYAYVGVCAQRVGVHGPVGLLQWSPHRYAGLDLSDQGTILDDELSADVFSQAAQAIRSPARGADIMGGLLTVSRIIAIGGSLSEGYLVIYHNSIHPLANVFDGYVLHKGIGSQLPANGKLRTDLRVKVFKVDTETDLLFFGEVAARQPDSDHLRTYEVAGASHVGFDGFDLGQTLRKRDGLPLLKPELCTIQPALSHVPSFHVLNAVYDHLSRWVTDGTLPPKAPLVDVISVGLPAVLNRTPLGLATGGIQLSQQAVPTAVENGFNLGPVLNCIDYGSHLPFDAATLAQLYPNHGAYVSAVSHVSHNNVEAGYILQEDAQTDIVDAAHSSVGHQ